MINLLTINFKTLITPLTLDNRIYLRVTAGAELYQEEAGVQERYANVYQLEILLVTIYFYNGH